MKVWSYIERHHQDLGVGLFILPVMALGLVAGGIAYGVTLLLFG